MRPPEQARHRAPPTDPGAGRLTLSEASMMRQSPARELVEERVELRLELLKTLRDVPDDVERYVRVYTEASRRRILSSTLVDQIRREHPEWQTVADTFRQIRPLGRTEDVERLPPEIQQLAGEFDEKREAASAEIRLAVNPAQGADLGTIKDNVFNLAWEMREVADDIADRCDGRADDLFRDIRRDIQVLFGQIDEQIRHRQSAPSAAYAHEPDAAAFGMAVPEQEAPHAKRNQRDTVYDSARESTDRGMRQTSPSEFLKGES